jgi:hypothetical protein
MKNILWNFSIQPVTFTTPEDSVVLPERVNQGFDVGVALSCCSPMGSTKVFKGT